MKEQVKSSLRLLRLLVVEFCGCRKRRIQLKFQNSVLKWLEMRK